MKISKEQLNKIIASHGKWLRNEKGGKCASLCGADLSGADLSEADLSEADLCGADLSGVNLLRANLYRADLCGAYLRDANLTEANLSEANLSGAYLCRANLYRANLCEVYLRDADLCGAYLRDADLRGAYLCGADLREAVIDKRYYQVVRIGSQEGVTTYCVDDDNVLCGCWNSSKGGTLAEFKQRVEDVYGENGQTPDAQYYAEYMAAIKFFEEMRKIAGGMGK